MLAATLTIPQSLVFIHPAMIRVLSLKISSRSQDGALCRFGQNGHAC